MRSLFHKTLALPLLLLLAGLSTQSCASPDGQGRENAPVFVLKDLDGKDVSLSAFKGKVVILDFWATWCPPCRAEIPGFIKLMQEYGGKDLAIIGVALDEPGKVAQFVKDFGVNYTVLMGSDKVVQDYGGIRGIPTTFVIDKQGRIARKYVGYKEADVFKDDYLKIK